MKRPGGSQLKMPQVKAPAFLTDLYHDLRDRRLLPLIALVVVAIVATPFLLGQGSDTPPEAVTPAAIEALKEEAGASRQAALTVVQADPGLRDYRKRLRRREPLDPFRSLGKPSLKGARLGGGGGGDGGGSSSSSSSSFSSTSTTVKETTKKTKDSESTTTTETTTTTTDESEGGGGGGSLPAPGPSTGGGKGKGEAVLFNFAVDLTIVHASGSGADKRKSEPQVRKKVLPATPLPSKQTQVVTYIGLSPQNRKPLFLISTEVTGSFGEGKCVAGTETCQLIELEPGFPQTFEYGESGDRYKLKVTGVEVVVTGKL